MKSLCVEQEVFLPMEEQISSSSDLGSWRIISNLYEAYIFSLEVISNTHKVEI